MPGVVQKPDPVNLDPDELQVVVLNEVLIRHPAQLTLRKLTIGLHHDANHSHPGSPPGERTVGDFGRLERVSF
jgi:hypothetical protein